MTSDYLTMEHEEVQLILANIREAEKTLHSAEVNYRSSIFEERYLSGEELCDYLHISIRTLQTLRDTRKIPFTVVVERTILYPEAGVREILDRNYRPTEKQF